MRCPPHHSPIKGFVPITLATIAIVCRIAAQGQDFEIKPADAAAVITQAPSKNTLRVYSATAYSFVSSSPLLLNGVDTLDSGREIGIGGSATVGGMLGRTRPMAYFYTASYTGYINRSELRGL